MTDIQVPFKFFISSQSFTWTETRSTKFYDKQTLTHINVRKGVPVTRRVKEFIWTNPSLAFVCLLLYFNADNHDQSWSYVWQLMNECQNKNSCVKWIAKVCHNFSSDFGFNAYKPIPIPDLTPAKCHVYLSWARCHAFYGSEDWKQVSTVYLFFCVVK